MWRAKHRAERRGEAWPPPEPPKPEPRSSVLSDRPKGPPRRVFRELEARDELVANMLLEMTWFPTSELWLEPAGGKRMRIVLEYGRVVIGVAVLDEYGDAAVLRALAVRATCRRQKHGRALVEYIVRHAYEVGVGRMYAVRASPPGHHRRAQQRLRFRADADPDWASRAATERAALGGRGTVDPVRTEDGALKPSDRGLTDEAPPGRPRWPRARQ
jgi:GNAT superfamily N-acetyltransferase